MKQALSFFLIFLVQQWIFAQPGCQDPLAQNFNPQATSTNSTCIYSATTAPLSARISSLPTLLNESSALMVTDGRVFTIVDSGNEADIFEIDSTSGQIKKKTRISNYSNVDWEDMAADSQYIYVGDFGNNNGDRTNLRILKVRKSAVYHPDSLNIQAQRLSFNYPDQSTFVSSSTNNFDCESLIYFNNRLHLFSKNRGNRKTKHYSLDPNSAFQTAVLHDSLNVNGLITSAAIRKDGKVVVLLGLDQTGSLPVFVWLLFGFQNSDFFSGNRRRIELPGVLSTGQAEGIGFASETRLWISNEKVGNLPPRVKQLNIQSYINSFFTDVSDVEIQTQKQTLYPNPVSDFLHLEFNSNCQYAIVNAQGKRVLSGNSTRINVKNFPSGLYHIILNEPESFQKRKVYNFTVVH